MRNIPCFVTRPMHTPSSCGKSLQPIPSLCLLFLAASFRKLRPLTRDHWSAGSMHQGSMAARSPHTRSLCELAQMLLCSPFGCQAPENLGSRKRFRSSSTFCPFTGFKGAKIEDAKNYIQQVRLHLLPRLHQFQIKGRGVRGREGKNESGLQQWQRDVMSVSYYSKGGLLNLSRLQSPESHQKVRRQISQGAARVSNQGPWCKDHKGLVLDKDRTAHCVHSHLHSQGFTGV